MWLVGCEKFSHFFIAFLIKIKLPSAVDLLLSTLTYLRYLQLLELFGCGTACVVSPVNRIHYMGEDINIPTMKQHNPMFEQLKAELTDIQYGRKEHPWAVTID